MYSQKIAIDEKAILDELPTSLAIEITDFLGENLIGKISVFSCLSRLKWSVVLSKLRPCIFFEHDIIYQQNRPCKEAFFTVAKKMIINFNPDLIKGNKYAQQVDVENEYAQQGTFASIFCAKSLELQQEKERMKKKKQRFSWRFDEKTESVLNGVDIVGYIVQNVELLNVLPVTNLWPICVETMAALHTVETYSIRKQDMLDIFADDPVWLEIRNQAGSQYIFDTTRVEPAFPLGRPIRPIWVDQT